MTNTQRNTLVLFALVIMVFFGGGWWLRTMAQKKKDTDQRITIVSNQIVAIEQQISEIDNLRRQLEVHKQMIAHQSKIIFLEDTPTITYRYILKLMSWMQRNTIFNFAHNSTGSADKKYNEYVINGRSHFGELLSLIQNIEYQRAMLTLEEVSIAADNVANSDTVSYSMVLRTHFSEIGVDPEIARPKSFAAIPLRYQLFKSRVYEQAPPRDIDPVLLKVESAVLIGLTQSKAFVRDDKGIIRILSVGDPVALGYLDRIDLAEGKAVFKINRFGLYEDNTLFLKKN